MWPATRAAELLGVRYPIVQAPMAGGFTTPALVAAVSNAGALGSLGGAMLSPDDLRAAIGEVRSLTEQPFAVNLFAPLPPPAASAEQIAAVQALLAPYRAELGLPEPEPPRPMGSPFEAQLAVVVEERVPVFSFTFGIPPLEPVREAGAVVLGTATTVAEAVELERAGVDAVVAQGAEAGGHRGTFLGPTDRGLVGGLALVPQVVDAVSVPVLAAGGIMDGRGIAAALALGAEGVSIGTAFLASREAGTPEAYRRALAESSAESTLVTRVYTGRHARTVRTPLIDAVEDAGLDIPDYPLQGALLGDIRGAAIKRGRADLMLLLAGQGAPMSRELGAAELVETLVREADARLRSL